MSSNLLMLPPKSTIMQIRGVVKARELWNKCWMLGAPYSSYRTSINDKKQNITFETRIYTVKSALLKVTCRFCITVDNDIEICRRFLKIENLVNTTDNISVMPSDIQSNIDLYISYRDRACVNVFLSKFDEFFPHIRRIKNLEKNLTREIETLSSLITK